MKVSIITVCYNSGSTIESTIRSVLMQDYNDIEYIVIDGKSSDETVSIIQKYKNRISTFISEKDNGMYFALNKGIAMASGDIIGFLHADDFYPDEKIISHVVNEFQASNCKCVYGDLQYVDRNNDRKIIRNWKSKPFQKKLFLQGWMPPHPTFFAKRECYTKFGDFNTLFSISADYELMLRFLYKNNLPASYIPKVLVKMRTGGISNVSYKSRLLANREDRMAWKTNGLKPNSFTLVLKPLSKLRQFFS